jgi:hypothetical protein
MQGPNSSSRRDRRLRARSQSYWVEALLAALVVGSVLAIGSVHPHSVLIVSLVALYAGGRAAYRIGVPPPALVAVGLSAFCLLQALPLPFGVVESIAPSNADVWGRALRPFGEGPPRYASVSLDPGASLVEALKWLSYGGVFVAAAYVARQRRISLVLTMVFGAGLLVAIVTMLHALFGAERVYGVYTPTFPVASRHVGPLLNPNNLAGYLNLAVFCGLAVLSSRDETMPRWATALGLLVLIGATLRTASRAGTVLLVIGVVTFLVLLWAMRRSRRESPRGQLGFLGLVFGVLAGGVVLGIAGNRDEIWRDLTESGLGKITMWTWTQRMIADFPVWGVGRGAFETAFGPYRASPLSGNIVVTHPENFIAQWATEWGLPVTLAALALFVATMRPWRLGILRRTGRVAAVLGIAILLLHNFVDLGLEVAGIAIAAAAVLGALWGESEFQAIELRASRWQRRVVPLVAAACAVAWTATAFAGTRHVKRDRLELMTSYRSAKLGDAGARKELRLALRDAIERHPGDAYLPLLGALIAYRAADQDPVPWLQRVLERDLFSGRAHYVLAHVLKRRGALEQALLELRLAGESDPRLRPQTGVTAVGWAESLDALMRAVPAGAGGAMTLETACVRLKDVATRTRCMEEAISRTPEYALFRRILCADLLRESELPDSPYCGGAARERCLQLVERHAKALRVFEPNSSGSAEFMARALMLRGQNTEAERLLVEECGARELSLSCLRTRVEAAARMEPPLRMDDAIEQLRKAACATEESCAGELDWIANRVLAEGNVAAALLYASRAARQAPTPQRWTRVVEIAKRAGHEELAAEAERNLAKLQE